MPSTGSLTNERLHGNLPEARFVDSPARTPKAIAPSRHLFGTADVVFFLVALVVFFTARQGLLDDPGLGWHLRSIDVMLARGDWLTEDPFTEPHEGHVKPWYNNQWLGELPFWLGERWAGEEGIAAAAALIVAFIVRCTYLMLLRDGLPWYLAVFWTSQAAMGISCSWVARPNLFTILFVLITSRICVLFHEGRCTRRATLWLFPLFVFWANVHGGFVAGFTLLGATLLVECFLGFLSAVPEGRQAARKRAGHVLFLLGGAFLSTLCNPYGVSLYRWVFQLLGDPYFMELHQEWKSPDFHAKGAIRFELLILLYPLLLALSQRRPNLVELILSLLWFHLALTGFRYVPLWVVVSVPLLARCSANVPWLREMSFRLPSGRGGDAFQLRPPKLTWAVGCVLFGLILLGIARGVEGRLARHNPEMIPSTSLDECLRLHREWRQTHGRRPILFHAYDWGGYLTWHGGPDFRNWIDDRNEVQGREHVQDYFSILATEPGWERKLAQHDIDLVCIQVDCPLTHQLSCAPSSWLVRHRDSWTVIFERVPNK